MDKRTYQNVEKYTLDYIYNLTHDYFIQCTFMDIKYNNENDIYIGPEIYAMNTSCDVQDSTNYKYNRMGIHAKQYSSGNVRFRIINHRYTKNQYQISENNKIAEAVVWYNKMYEKYYALTYDFVQLSKISTHLDYVVENVKEYDEKDGNFNELVSTLQPKMIEKYFKKLDSTKYFYKDFKFDEMNKYEDFTAFSDFIYNFRYKFIYNEKEIYEKLYNLSEYFDFSKNILKSDKKYKDVLSLIENLKVIDIFGYHHKYVVLGVIEKTYDSDSYTPELQFSDDESRKILQKFIKQKFKMDDFYSLDKYKFIGSTKELLYFQKK